MDRPSSNILEDDDVEDEEEEIKQNNSFVRPPENYSNQEQGAIFTNNPSITLNKTDSPARLQLSQLK